MKLVLVQKLYFWIVEKPNIMLMCFLHLIDICANCNKPQRRVLPGQLFLTNMVVGVSFYVERIRVSTSTAANQPRESMMPQQTVRR